jgi:phospholipid/cholesterol/gamma-HCH transport system permease protein
MTFVVQFGAWIIARIAQFGDFCRFSGRAVRSLPALIRRRQGWATMIEQCFDIGTRSLPVVMVTGGFVGAVLAVQTVTQFKAIGMIDSMGTIVNMSVLRELGPILAGVILAGRVGGGQTAELGTMRVTEQIEALRAIGADPIGVLVAPRFLACMVIIPLLCLYTSLTGILGGFVISVHLYGANAAQFWANAADTVQTYDIFYGPVKSLFFGGVMSLICCYKGFHCQAGAAGVGRACTESFVASCMAILGLDFFLGMFMNSLIEAIWGLRVLLG